MEPNSKGNVSKSTRLLGAQQRFKRRFPDITSTVAIPAHLPVGAQILNDRHLEQESKLRPAGRLDIAVRRNLSADGSVKQMSGLPMFGGHIKCSKEPQVDWESLIVREGTFPLPY